MESQYILTLDLGSSSCKLCLWNSNGIMVCRERVYYTPERTAEGRVEMEPLVWWEAVVRGMNSLFTGHAVRRESIRAIVPIGHITTLIFLDRDMKPLRRALLYSDRRASREADELYTLFSQKELDKAYGFHLPASPSWPLPRLLWIQRNEPETLGASRVILQPKDYVLYRLTGELCTDPDSSRGLIQFKTGKPDPDLFGKLDLPTDRFAPVKPPGEVAGTIAPSACAELGLPAGIPVLTGWNDFNAAVYGCGITSGDTGFDITGTTEHIGCRIFHGGRVPAFDRRLVQAPFETGSSLIYGATLASGGSLTWFTENFSPADKPGGENARTVLSYISWMERIESGEAGAQGLMYLPYLDGERSPLWDTHARGAFIGLSSSHTWKDMLRAVLEGVSAGLNQIFRLTQKVRKVTSVRITGGYAELELWNRIKASFYNIPVHVLETDEAAGLGGALLGAQTLGWHPDYETAVSEMVRIRSVTEPQTGWVSLYEKKQELFDGLYPVLKSTFSAL